MGPCLITEEYRTFTLADDLGAEIPDHIKIRRYRIQRTKRHHVVRQVKTITTKGDSIAQLFQVLHPDAGSTAD